MKFTKNALMGSSSLTRPLLLLGTASALMGAGPAYALDANALPQGGTVTGGSATIAQSGTNTLNINQSSNRAIIDWRSFNVGSAATTNFAQPNSSSIAVNRVNASTNPSVVEGTINANGQVWILNPNGVFFGKTAQVNAAGIVASTANINNTEFMSGSNTLHMTGGDTGSVANDGHITVGQGGLAAFVAPSVRNSGTIQATVGKVSLAAGDSYTLDLAGDHLVEIATGATNAVVTQSGKVVNPGGTIEISAVAAGQVVDSVINMSGVTTASAATSSGGQIVLGADDINVASTAQTSADGGGTGNGGDITMVANKTGSYAGSYSAQGGADGGNGGNVETSGAVVNIDPNISVNTSAAKGTTGNWTLDPNSLDVIAGTSGTISGGTNGNGSSIGATTVDNALGTTNVVLQAKNSVTVDSAIDTHTNTDSHSLSINQQSGGNGGFTVTLNAPITLGVNETLNGQATTVNVGTSGLIQNGIDVAGSTNTSSAVTINVAAGIFNEALDITKNVDIEGVAGQTIIAPTSSSQLINTETGHKYTADMQATVFVNDASAVTLNDVTINGGMLGNDAVVFWNNSSGTISNAVIENTKPFTGVQTGQGLAVDATTNNTDILTVSNVAFSNWDKNGIDAETGDGTGTNGGSINLTVKNSSFTGQGPTSTIAQNGIVLWEQGGGTVNATISGSSFADLDYTGAGDTAAGVLQFGSTQGTVTVKTSTFDSSVQVYLSSAGIYTAGTSHNLTATNGNTFGSTLGVGGVTVNGSTPLSEIYAIEDKIIDGIDTGTDSLVQLVAGNEYVTQAKGLVTTAIQNAINLASTGDTVNIQAGTFAGPVDINAKTITLAGAGAGSTILDVPTPLNALSGSFDEILVENGANATIQKLTVNGLDEGDGLNQNSFNGIRVMDSDATINKVDITGFQDSGAPGGGQHGNGVYVTNYGAYHTVSLTNSTIEDFQKTGAVFQGVNLGVTITGNTITGAGNTSTIAQNGIFLYGKNGNVNTGTIYGTIANNTISGLSFNGNVTAAGMVLFSTDGLSVTGNTITGVAGAPGSVGIYASGFNNLSLTNNKLNNLGYGIELKAYGVGTGATISGGKITNSAVQGIYVGPNTNYGTISGVSVTNVTFAGNATQFVSSDPSLAAAVFQNNSFDAAALDTSGSTIFSTIQGAVNSSSSNDTIDLAGTFNEQVVINGESLTLNGNGATLNAPVTLSHYFTTPGFGNQRGIISVENGAYLAVNHLTINGLGENATNVGLDGIAVSNSTLNANYMTITGTRSGGVGGTLTGAQSGQGIASFDYGAAQQLTVTNSTIEDFQKNGIFATGANLDTDLESNIITGAGPTGVIAQNGIVLDGVGSNNIVTYNNVNGVSFTGPGAAAVGILVLNSPEALVSYNNINATAAGRNVYTDGIYVGGSSNVELARNNIFNTGYGIYINNSSSVGVNGGTIANNIFGIQIGSGSSFTDVINTTFQNNDVQFQGLNPGGASEANFALNTGGNSFDATAVNEDTNTNNTIYGNLQTAVDGAVSTDTLDLNGTFTGQANIANNMILTLNGHGTTTIDAPTGGMDASFTTQIGYVPATTAYAVIGVTQGDTVTIENLAINGEKQGNANDYFLGIGADDANLTVSNVQVSNIIDHPDNGDQTGVGIGVYNEDNVARNVSITGSSVSDFQKNGIALQGGKLTVDVEDNVITGSGNINNGANAPAQNGIELFGLSGGIAPNVNGNITGTVNDNIVTGVSWNGGSYGTSAGILLLNTRNVTVSGNVLTGAGKGNTYSIGLAAAGSTGLNVSYNNITKFGTGIAAYDYTGIGAAGQRITIANNLINNNGIGVEVGYLSTDTTNVTATNNDLSGNNTAVEANSTGTPTLNFSGNWWGTTTANAIEGQISGADGGAVDISPFLNSGTNALFGSGDNGFVGDFSSLTVTTDGGQTGTQGRINEALADVTMTSGGDNGTVDVNNGTYTVNGASDEDVKVIAPVNLDFGNDVTVNSLTVTNAGAGTDLSGKVFAQSIALNGAVGLDDDLTLNTNGGVPGSITIKQVDGTNGGDQNLTLNAGGNAISVGSLGGNIALGTITDNNDNVTLTGANYDARAIAFGGGVTLARNVTMDVTAATTGAATDGSVTLGSEDGDGNNENLTIKVGTGSSSLGDAGDSGNDLGTLTAHGLVTLTGNSYSAADLVLGNVTLTKNTTLNATDISSSDTGVTIASVDGTGTGNDRSLTITTGGSTVALGDVSGNDPVGAVNDENTTTLTGNYYAADSFELGGVTLTRNNTTFDTTENNVDGDITLSSVYGNGSGGNLALAAGTGNVNLGDVGQNAAAVGTLTAIADNQTNLTGANYTGGEFDFGEVVLKNDVTIDTSAAGGNVNTGDINGAGPNRNLTITTGGGTVTIAGDITSGLANVTDENTTVLEGETYNANRSLDFGDTTLTDGGNSTPTTITFTTNTGDITLASVDAQHAGVQLLDVEAAGIATLGDTGSNKRLGDVEVDGPAVLDGHDYEANNFEFDGPVTLKTNVTVNVSADDGFVAMYSVDGSGANGGQNLTIKTGTTGTPGPFEDAVYLGDIGDNKALGNVTVSDTDSVLLAGSSYQAASFDLAHVGLTTDTTIDTSAANGDITVGQVDNFLTGANSLTLNVGSGTVSLGDVGDYGALNNVQSLGNTTLTGSNYLAASFDLGPTFISTGTTIDTSKADTGAAADGDITLASLDNAAFTGPNSLTLVTGTGTASLGNVGQTNGALDMVGDTSAGDVTLTGGGYDAASFDFAGVLLGANVTADVNASGNVTMTSVNGNSAGNGSLDIDAGSTDLGNVGVTTSLAQLETQGPTTLTGTTYKANSETFGALTLDANTTLNTSADNGALTVASVDGSTAGGQSLTLNAGSGTVSLGNTGSSTRLGALTDTSNTTLTGGTYNANSEAFGALTLDANTTLNTSADNGALTVASVNGSTAGGQSLTLNSGSGTTSLGNTGASTRLGALSASGPITLTGNTYDANSETFGGNVTLTAATTTLNTTQSASAAGDITFNSNIFGTTNGGQSLVLTAGPGTGSASANGNMTLQNAGTSGVQLDNVTVSGNNFTVLTLDMTGNFTSTLTGNQTFAANTLNAGGNVNANVGGNSTGHMVVGGNIVENVGGNISGVITAANMTLTAGSVTNATLTASNDINVVAGTISNTTANAPFVSMIANSINGTTVTANIFNVSALTGSVSGTWGTLNAITGLNLRLNGQLAGFENFNGQQLVVEGFTLPDGTQIGPNGALILPQGVLVGLLSPGGGEPRVVMVHSVQELGELLSEGYVAIVIDLDGRKKDDGQMVVASN